jgi:peptidyl-tRNA hydrolase, PTH1 family
MEDLTKRQGWFVKLIVGLGNPGPRYENTRHNVGFWVIDRLSEQWGIPVNKEKWKGLSGTGRVGTETVTLLKPMTFMNLSGESVRPAMDWLKCTVDDVLIIYDDLDLPLGHLRLRLKGSSGGHNGVKSVVQHLGTQSIKRIKIGIGRPQTPQPIPDYVLSPFAPDEQDAIVSAVRRAADAVNRWLETDSFLIAMNEFNQN